MIEVALAIVSFAFIYLSLKTESQAYRILFFLLSLIFIEMIFLINTIPSCTKKEIYNSLNQLIQTEITCTQVNDIYSKLAFGFGIMIIAIVFLIFLSLIVQSLEKLKYR